MSELILFIPLALVGIVLAGGFISLYTDTEAGPYEVKQKNWYDRILGITLLLAAFWFFHWALHFLETW